MSNPKTRLSEYVEMELDNLNELIEKEKIDLGKCNIEDDDDLIVFALKYMAANLDHALELGYPEKETENKTIVIEGKLIEYWYNDDFDGEMDSADEEHVAGLLSEEFTEGDLETFDEESEEGSHSGWWKVV
jgi:hypothetical protein